jgi:hypothetical protein
MVKIRALNLRSALALFLAGGCWLTLPGAYCRTPAKSTSPNSAAARSSNSGVQKANKDRSAVITVAEGSHPALVADAKNNLHVVFQQKGKSAKYPDIFYTHSLDHGATWSRAINISQTAGDSQEPAIAVEKNGALDLVWSDNSSDLASPDIFFARSTDMGETWTKPQDISSSPGISAQPAIAVGPDDSIHIVWSDQINANNRILYACSKDSGTKWTPAATIDQEDSLKHTWVPAIAVDPEKVVHAAWSELDKKTGKTQVVYTRCINDEWSKPQNVSRTVDSAGRPALACSRASVYLGWFLHTAAKGTDIYLTIGGPDGKFGNILRMSNEQGLAAEPQVTADGNDIVITWSGEVNADNKSRNIFCAGSVDGGGEFCAPINVSNSPASARKPHATIAGGKDFVVWEEKTAKSGESLIKFAQFDIKGLPARPAPLIDPKHKASESPTSH